MQNENATLPNASDLQREQKMLQKARTEVPYPLIYIRGTERAYSKLSQNAQIHFVPTPVGLLWGASIHPGKGHI